jgi:hypothetical protein
VVIELNREYLEKLFQTRVPVPLPRPDKMTEGMMAQLNSHQLRRLEQNN